jgi:competence protein ComFC
MSVAGAITRPVYRLYRMVWAGLDWVYPPQCGGCGEDGSRWCTDCQENTQILNTAVCEVCGRVLASVGICASCRQNPPLFQAVRSWAIFGGPLRSAIHRLKYYGDMALADELAIPMLSLLNSLCWNVDIVIPVPISASRKSERGYNQAALLAFPLALGSNIPYRSTALWKVRNTQTQVGLSVK